MAKGIAKTLSLRFCDFYSIIIVEFWNLFLDGKKKKKKQKKKQN